LTDIFGKTQQFKCLALQRPARSGQTMKKFLKMRSAIGADTPAGHRVSNIDEVRQNKAKAAGDPAREAYLDASMARQLRDLAATRHPK
jgi:hypothetical protein